MAKDASDEMPKIEYVVYPTGGYTYADGSPMPAKDEAALLAKMNELALRILRASVTRSR